MGTISIKDFAGFSNCDLALKAVNTIFIKMVAVKVVVVSFIRHF